MIKNQHKKRIIIFSPHLDDAALDLCDHILFWKKQSYEVEIVTVFSSFKTSHVSHDVRVGTGIANRSVLEFERARKLEDKNAMGALGVKWRHLDFVDGGFRQYKQIPVYKDFLALFCGSISQKDKASRKKSF